MTPLDFARSLLPRGIELVLVRGRQLSVWPPGASKSLSPEERDYLRQHRAALIELARAKAIPETTIDFHTGLPFGAAPATPLPPAAPAPPPECPYCGRPCVGPEHRMYRVLHWHAPDEVARRNADATKRMMLEVGQPHVRWD